MPSPPAPQAASIRARPRPRRSATAADATSMLKQRKLSDPTKQSASIVATHRRRYDPDSHRARRRPHRALALLAIAVTLAICVAAGPRIRARSTRSILRATEAAGPWVKRAVENGTENGAEEHGHGSLLRIPYDKLYEECPPALKPLFVAFLVVTIVFLFCSVTITASDFFCPNLATVAAYLGLSEATAGVTLLAFGNGSPDVFSTFVAVRQGTFGLAVGELIGAASFITSIVVGSIAMVQPFHVPKFAFLRDVAFFTLAVCCLMAVLHDGHLTIRESGIMVLIYAIYVVVVVLGSWWSARKRRKEAYAELGWKAGHDEEALPHTVEMELPGPSESLTLTPTYPNTRRASVASQMHHRQQSEGPTEDEAADTQRAAWSLLGAIEFRDAVNALKREGHSPGSSRANSRPGSPLPEHQEEYFGSRSHHRRPSSAALGRDSSIRRAGRSRSSSLVATWLSRSRQSSGETTGSESAFATLPPPSPLTTVPGSPMSGTTPPQLPVDEVVAQAAHPADDSEEHPLAGAEAGSHPLAQLAPRLRNLRVQIAAEDEPLTMSPVASAVDIPSIAVVDPHGDAAFPRMPITRTNTQVSLADHVNHTFHRVVHTLFPSLQGFTKKSLVGMILAVLSTPALFVLTITLPVVDDGRGDEGGIELPGAEDEALNTPVDGDEDEDTLSPLAHPHSPVTPRDRHPHLLGADVGDELHHLVDSGPTLHPRLPESSAIVRSGASCTGSDDGQDEEECVLEFSPRLTAMQCIFGPVVCSWLLFQDEDYVGWVLFAAAAIGVAAAVVVKMLAEDGTAQPWRLIRCCAGFVCSMIWIATIADEVVSILHTFGEIFGLSDAIIGLTIFAVGNSLADLVANVTIAQFAPNMAYAACFGGPMLNLLLGIGGSGTYSILTSPRPTQITIDFSPTLWVSGTGLLLILAGTAIIVPLNSYFIDRRWAMVLLIGYATIMTANVVVEIRSERHA